MNSIGKRSPQLLVVAIAVAAVALVYANVGSSAAGPEGAATARSTAEAEELIFGKGLPPRLEDALGDDFAGLWIERATAQLHVGVTSPASRQLAEAVAARTGTSEIVTTTHVDSTWTQLLAAQRQLNDQLADLLDRGEARTAVSASGNQVEVELGSSVSSAREAEVQASRVGVDTSVSISAAPRMLASPQAGRCNKYEKGKDKSACDKPIVSGVKIRADLTGETCSAGPTVITEDLSNGTKATETYLLTAGHCIVNGGGVKEKWSAWTKAGAQKLIGEAKTGMFGHAGPTDKVDIGVIKIESADWVHASDTPVTPAIAPWNKAEEAEPTAITKMATSWPIEGAKVCVSGETSGTHCGVVYEPSVTAPFGGGVFVETLVEVTGEPLTEAGDSGAPWFWEASPGEALGTHVGITPVREKTGKKHMIFQMLWTSLENLGTKYQLLTTANQKRKHPAAGPPMTASSYPATLTGSGSAEGFSTEGGEVKCSSHFEGTLPGITTTLTVVPKYTSCLAFGVVEATVNMEGCAFEFHSTEEFSESEYGLHTDVLCPAGQSIKIVAGTCKLEIKEQTGLTSVKATNESGSVKVNPEVNNLAYTVTQDGFLCPFAGTGDRTDGKYTGQVTLSKVGGGSVDITGE